MDRLAPIGAWRCTRKRVVTACCEKIVFRAPVKQEKLTELVGKIRHVGRTFLTVETDRDAGDIPLRET